MRTFQYYEYSEAEKIEPTTVTEEEIIRDWYPEWCDKMRKVGREHLISKEECILDWCAIHWAWEVEGDPS